MKKSIIALAVAGAMTAPMVAQADATLFGEARYDVTKEKDTSVDSDLTRIRIGVKGEETMDSGLTAGYFIRMSLDDGEDVQTQKAALYVAGDFGKVVMGQADSPSALVEDRVAYVTAYGDALGINGTEWDHSGLTYQSNDLNGLKFQFGIGNVNTGDNIEDGDANNANTENSYSALVTYDTDVFGVSIGAGKDSAKEVNTSGASHYAISGEYKFGAGAIGVVFGKNNSDSTVEVDGVDTAYEKQSYSAISGKYVIDKLTLAAQYESRKISFADVPSETAKATSVSAAYSLGGNATVSIAAVNYNDDAESLAKKDAVKVRYHVTF